MSSKKNRNTGVLNEIIMIRAIACLSIVMLHSITFSVNYSEVGISLLTVATILSSGTPTFVFISALLLSYSYSDQLPRNFYWKRIKFIFFPFAFMALFYACVQFYQNPGDIIKNTFSNLAGGYHGWFVLVIFQFYILHQLFTKFLVRFKSVIVLFISFIINISYLSVFNFIDAPSEHPFVRYLWSTGYWLTFLGWLFYFALAFYCGRNYKAFISCLKRYKKFIYIALPLTVCLLAYTNISQAFVGSKRVDVVPFTVIYILFLYLIFYKIKKPLVIFKVVSEYSFGIYLTHMFYLRVLNSITDGLELNLGYFKIIILFIGTLLLSLITINIVNKFTIGKYLVGRINRKTPKRVKVPTGLAS
ncbi:acyltransferase family protein [Priestia aryabhattai]|uniref:acyltransferase family protein n=1 Tax=Priestia aryabhattai TaxID=412384 RepID=UPI003D268365